MSLPPAASINEERIARFKQRISDTLAQEDLSQFHAMLEQIQIEQNVAPLDIAAALAKLLQGNAPLLLDKVITRERSVGKRERFDKKSKSERHDAEKPKPHPGKQAPPERQHSD